MNITAESPRIICSNPLSIHSYFGWPTVARLADGSLAAVASGFRLRHVCPFGKVVLCRSFDEGESWTKPEILLDTPLDDRDAGILPFGKNRVIVTSFNNTPAFQREWAKDDAYINAYLDRIEKRDDLKNFLGSTYVLSEDGGRTFGGMHISPVTSPHGPMETRDGRVLWVGRFFDGVYGSEPNEHVGCCELMPDDTFKVIGTIPDVSPDLLSCEPHAIETADGKILVHIRVQNRETFTICQSVSSDGGHTFSAPRQLLGQRGGSPAHLIRVGDALVSVYGYREKPFGLRFMVSRDEGETWDTDHVLYDASPDSDLGYPATVMLRDGSLLTVFYCHPASGEPAVIMEIRWRLTI